MESKISSAEVQTLLKNYATIGELQSGLRDKVNLQEIKIMLDQKDDIGILSNEIQSLQDELETVFRDLNKKISELPSDQDFAMLQKQVGQKAGIQELGPLRDLERKVLDNTAALQNQIHELHHGLEQKPNIVRTQGGLGLS